MRYWNNIGPLQTYLHDYLDWKTFMILWIERLKRITNILLEIWKFDQNSTVYDFFSPSTSHVKFTATSISSIFMQNLCNLSIYFYSIYIIFTALIYLTLKNNDDSAWINVEIINKISYYQSDKTFRIILGMIISIAFNSK